MKVVSSWHKWNPRLLHKFFCGCGLEQVLILMDEWNSNVLSISECHLSPKFLFYTKLVEVDANTNFWLRATLEGPNRSFVLVFVGVVETWVKNLPNGTKIVQGNKNVLREQKKCKEAQYGIELHCKLPCMIFCGLLLPCVSLLFMVFCLYIAVSRGHRSKLTTLKTLFCCQKIFSSLFSLQSHLIKIYAKLWTWVTSIANRCRLRQRILIKNNLLGDVINVSKGGAHCVQDRFWPRGKKLKIFFSCTIINGLCRGVSQFLEKLDWVNRNLIIGPFVCFSNLKIHLAIRATRALLFLRCLP